ncbi:hypothetical protein BDN67DRAFT_1069420, partial [Paxillus ammoniavirescens]
MGAPLVYGHQDIDQMVMLNSLANGCLQARLFDSVAAACLNPIRFEWVPRRESRYEDLQIPTGTYTPGVSTDSDLELEEPNFLILGMTWGLRSLLQSWTRLEAIEMVGLCLLEMDAFNHFAVSLPCRRITISDRALGSRCSGDFWRFFAGPGRI